MPPETTATATGATPGAGATPEQATTEVAAAGATPAVAAGTKPAPAAPPATGEEALGDAGKAILSQARREAKEAKDAAAALQTQLEALQTGTQTEHERAVGQARREAKSEADGKWAAHIRAAEVRGALRGAGIVNENFLSLAMAAEEFRSLKVDGETGAVDGVTAAVEAFKTKYPEAFGTKAEPGPGGSWGGSEGGRSEKQPETLHEGVMDALAHPKR